MKPTLLAGLITLCAYFNFSQDSCPDILSTNPNNSNNQAVLYFMDGNLDTLAGPCNCNLAGVGNGTGGNYNCGSCMPEDWSFASINGTPCTNPDVLPVELTAFWGLPYSNHNLLHWSTASERDNDYFLLLQSTDGMNFGVLGTVSGSGSTNISHSYQFQHDHPEPVINYYLLIQVDYDGKQQQYGPVALDNRQKNKVLIGRYNSIGQEVNANFSGIQFERYSDGSVVKRMQE